MTTDGKSTSKGKYGFHALRHAAASLFIAHLGWTPKRVQTVMGHAKISMTYDLYGHLFDDPEADREAMKKIEAAVRAA
jgi:integrase